MTHYFVKWKNEEAKGSVDLIDDTLLKAKKKKSGLSHLTDPLIFRRPRKFVRARYFA